MIKRALITGVTGQDGSYLVEWLSGKGYEVHGLVFNKKNMCLDNINKEVRDSLVLHNGDLTNSLDLAAVIKKVNPQEIYNLGAQSHIGTSFKYPVKTAQVNAMGMLNLLEALRTMEMIPSVKVFQASSSEIYGSGVGLINEESKVNPLNPYAVSKLFAHQMIKTYREAHGLFGCNGILFNHESPRRGYSFVTMKIVKGIVDYKTGNTEEPLMLGNLNASRDWGYAKDYVKAMWMTLQHDEPGDYIIASGQVHSVRDFVTAAANACEIDLEWRGKGLHEHAVDTSNGETVIQVSQEFFREVETEPLVGDNSKAKKELGWSPSLSFESLVQLMVESELRKSN